MNIYGLKATCESGGALFTGIGVTALGFYGLATKRSCQEKIAFGAIAAGGLALTGLFLVSRGVLSDFDICLASGSWDQKVTVCFCNYFNGYL